MSMLLSRILRFAAQKIALSPQARTVAARVAREMAGEAKLIAREKDKARAAGRSVRRVINRLQGGADRT